MHDCNQNAHALRWRRRMRRLAVSGVVVVVLWLLVSFAIAYRLTRRPRPRFAEPAPVITWGKIEPLRLQTRDGHDIGGWFVPGSADGPVVLLLHGNKGSRWNSLGNAEQFAARGCSTLMISLRAHGDSSGARNDIGFSARNDVVAAVDYLEQTMPGRPILIHGVSLGAAAAIFSSAELADRVRGYILEAPYRDLKTAVRNRTREALPPLLDAIAYQGMLLVSPLVLSDVDAISPLKAASGIPEATPVLIFSGSRDVLARVEESRAIHARIKTHARLVVMEGAGHHNIVRSDPARYWTEVTRFLDRIRGGTGHRRDSGGRAASNATPLPAGASPPAGTSPAQIPGETTMTRLLHILRRSDWEAARAAGIYRPSSLESEGFIHLSTPEQIIGTANLFFAGQSDLVVLEIDPRRIEPQIRWEPAPETKQSFPHLYGPLDLDSVSGTRTLEHDAKGVFVALGPLKPLSPRP